MSGTYFELKFFLYKTHNKKRCWCQKYVVGVISVYFYKILNIIENVKTSLIKKIRRVFFMEYIVGNGAAVVVSVSVGL